MCHTPCAHPPFESWRQQGQTLAEEHATSGTPLAPTHAADTARASAASASVSGGMLSSGGIPSSGASITAADATATAAAVTSEWSAGGPEARAALFGGAQYYRLMSEFRAAVEALPSMAPSIESLCRTVLLPPAGWPPLAYQPPAGWPPL